MELLIALLMLISPATMPECATEDSVLCYWNAAENGNGEGQSFFAITDDLIIHTN